MITWKTRGPHEPRHQVEYIMPLFTSEDGQAVDKALHALGPSPPVKVHITVIITIRYLVQYSTTSTTHHDINLAPTYC